MLHTKELQLTKGADMSRVYTTAKQFVRRVLESTTPGYLFYLRRDHHLSRSVGRPQAPWHNAVLKSREESQRAAEQVQNLGLPLISDPAKNWDSLAALDCILANTSKEARVLDAGAQLYSRILPWLCIYGYRKLDGINIAFKEKRKLGPIIYRYGDITNTEYNAETFDAITCISVVEHGVDIEKYLKEMSRILKPGGVLITSTDYWETPIDSRDQFMYGVPVHIFTKQEILRTVDLAERNGFVLTTPIDLGCSEKVVHWESVDLDYTFVIFTLRKAP